MLFKQQKSLLAQLMRKHKMIVLAPLVNNDEKREARNTKSFGHVVTACSVTSHSMFQMWAY